MIGWDVNNAVRSDVSFLVVLGKEPSGMRRNDYQTRQIGIMSQEPWMKIYVHTHNEIIIMVNFFIFPKSLKRLESQLIQHKST